MKVSYKRPAAMLLATVVAVVFAGSVSRTQRTRRSLWKLRKTPC